MNTTIQTLSKDKNYHIYRKITYNKGVGYKKIEYFYDIIVKGEVKESVCHNKKNPAVVIYNNNQITRIEYWYKGKLNRRYGPSIIVFDNKQIIQEMWYIDGVQVKDEDVEPLKQSIEIRKKIYKIRKSE